MAPEVFDEKKKLLQELSWSENPFVKDLRLGSREEFLKYYCPFDAKAVLLLGPKGTGKTSTLYYVRFSLPEAEFLPVFFKEPPQNLEQLAQQAGVAGEGLFSAFLGFLGLHPDKNLPISRKQLADRLREKDKKVVLFVDEAHLEKDPGMYMEFKYLLDEVPNLRIVFCALGKDNFPDSLLHLIGDSGIFVRHGFSEAEMRQIVAHRIRSVGGVELVPFPESFLRSVLSEQNLLSPRYVFDELTAYLAEIAAGRAKAAKPSGQYSPRGIDDSHSLASAAASRSVFRLAQVPLQQETRQQKPQEPGYEEPQGPSETKPAHMPMLSKRQLYQESQKGGIPQSSAGLAQNPAVRASAVPEYVPAKPQQSAALGPKMTVSNASWWDELSPSQATILKLLLQNADGIPLSDILSKTGLSQNTAFNALYQLRGEDAAEIGRKPRVPFPLVIVKHKLVGGKKKNIYYVASKIQKLFSMH